MQHHDNQVKDSIYGSGKQIMPDSSETLGQVKPLHPDKRSFVPFARSALEGSIPEIFEQRVRKAPDDIALMGESGAISYGELDRLSNRIAQAVLCRCGEDEDPVALLLRQGSEAVTTVLGLLKAGKIYVPLEPSHPAPELRSVIAHCQPRLIIGHGETMALARESTYSRERCLDYATFVSEGSEEHPRLRLSPDRFCYIFYTSGSTGPPKGVVDKHRNVLHNVMRYTNSLEIGAEDRMSLIQSCSFSGTVSSLFSALLNGAAICPFDMQRHGISSLAKWLRKERITVFHSTPAIFEELMSQRGDFPALRLIRLEGDRAAPRQIELFRSRFGPQCRLVNGLGMTEAGLVRQYFVTPATKPTPEIVPVGQAVQDMEVEIVDSAGSAIKAGEAGEIVIRSKYLASGYWRRPDLTEASFASDPRGNGWRTYRTGDLGRLDGTGCLYYLGRTDQRARLRGQWVETARIESALLSIGSVNHALAVVRADEDHGMSTQQLVAYLMVEGSRPSVSKFRQHLAKLLPTRMIPSHYVFVDSLPLDRHGKLDRRRLPAPRRERPSLDQAFVAPTSNEEMLVAACFGSVLDLDRVGVHDDFIDLGGDSLLAMKLLLEIEARMGVECPDALISRTFSVASLVRTLGEENPESTLVQIRAGDERPPLFCIHGHCGYVLEYYRLAACLEPGQAVYGLQSRAHTRAGHRDRQIEQMATAYLAEITTVQTTGPYFLCGNCFGGIIAFEIAQQLKRHGHEVALLALIDTAFPVSQTGPVEDFTKRLFDPRQWGELLSLPFNRWGAHTAHRFRNFARWSARTGKLLLTRTTGKARRDMSPLGFGRHSVLDQNTLAQSLYKPEAYDGEIVLFCPGTLGNQSGWTELAKGGAEIIVLPSNSLSKTASHLVYDPHVEGLAQHLSGYLATNRTNDQHDGEQTPERRSKL